MAQQESNVIIPIIRNLNRDKLPMTIASEIIGVQPMMDFGGILYDVR